MKKLSTFWRGLLVFSLLSIQIAGAQPYDFKVTTWNVEWLSCLDYKPFDRELQINNVVSVIKTMNSDLVALQEVGTSNSYKTMDTIVKRLGSEWAGSIMPWKVGNCYQNQAIIYKKSRVNFVNALLITNGGSSYDWSSGRFPALYNVNFVAGDEQIPVTFINIHAKAYADEASYNRRKNASEALKNALDASIYSTKKMVILGDFNDYLYGTQCKTCGGISPYKNFMDDPANYKGVTAEFSNLIDNIIISNELFDDYVSNSVFMEVSATQTIPNYKNTTSDHTPVSIIFRFPNDVSITEMPVYSSFSVFPNPTTGELRITVSVERYAVSDIDIYDIYGKKISSHHLITSSSHHLINIAHLHAGIYFLKIGNETVKVIKY
jgi:endonuclease/exonuclease/phosphatase family metal-dependent hydrolase